MKKMTEINLKMIKPMLILVSFSLAFATTSCDGKKKVDPVSSDVVRLNQEVKYDPSLAQVKLLEQPTLASADQVSELKVPGFKFQLVNADMARILRCNKDYVLRYQATGEPLATVAQRGDYIDPGVMKWAWLDAAQNPACRLLGVQITRTDFKDLAAQSGDYYYIINPCVSQPVSLTGLEDCSYNLILTNPLDYENELEPLFIEKAQQLAELEGKVSAHIANFLTISRHIRNKTRECEDLWAHKQSMKAFKNGIISLGAMVVGAVVGGIVAGPVGAMQGANTFGGIASGIMGPPSVEAAKCDKVTALVNQLENEYAQITPTVDQIVAVRKDMNKIESRYLSLDTTIQANNNGVSNPEGATETTDTNPDGEQNNTEEQADKEEQQGEQTGQ